MDIEATKKNGTNLVQVIGRMDAVSAPAFEEQITGMLQEGDKHFVIDFSQLEYISSAGLRSILASAKKIKASQGAFVLADLRDTVKEVFEISGFKAIIPIYDTVDAALSDM